MISINDPDARLMKNKKGRWEFDYNAQIAVDEHKGIIIASHVTNNPSDHHELIPSNRTSKKSNLSEIYNETPSNFQVSADNGYSTDIKMQNISNKKV